MTAGEIVELGRNWAAAEVAGDPDALAGMVADEFRLVGPLGFVLDREQWLDRYRSGALATQRLDWREVDVRVHGDTAIAIGVHDQEATHQGNRVDGTFRATHVLVRGGGGWRLAGMHLSPLGAPPAFAG
ncbi:nuclear transport factor 2 family protein [Amycolatopsis benzoatilytica]|uniref:nuclear transport factor 2 family protein n=1 Tax=Amycolatopsis benzoatilytica TaxID=346045 RepID=UPI0003720109|nr:nuclear transport factor 2 family protein [Amycolatopsis benzoatilytica]